MGALSVGCPPASEVACPERDPLLEQVKVTLDELADLLDSRADDLDPQGTAGHGRPWHLMTAARKLRDVGRQLASSRNASDDET